MKGIQQPDGLLGSVYPVKEFSTGHRTIRRSRAHMPKQVNVTHVPENAETPWERAQKTRSQKQEERTARMRGARKQPNSGRLWHSKGDVTLDSFLGRLLIDNKTTDKPENSSYRITRDDWEKLRRISNRTPPGCHPALQIDLQDLHLLVFELPLWDEIVTYVMTLEERIKKLEAGSDDESSEPE